MAACLRACGQGDQVGATPDVPGRPTVNLRQRLHNEEFAELAEALWHGDVARVAREIADCIYVLLGTACAYGVWLAPVWQAVHAANLAKAGGPHDATGKFLKPPGWAPPDVAAVLARQPPLQDTVDRTRQ